MRAGALDWGPGWAWAFGREDESVAHKRDTDGVRLQAFSKRDVAR